MASTVLEVQQGPALEVRLTRGADLLFDMEQRGDLGPDYARWLDHWLQLLAEYEASCAA